MILEIVSLGNLSNSFSAERFHSTLYFSIRLQVCNDFYVGNSGFFPPLCSYLQIIQIFEQVFKILERKDDSSLFSSLIGDVVHL